MAFLKQFPDVCWYRWIGRNVAAHLAVNHSAAEEAGIYCVGRQTAFGPPS